jgi:hypothetical protein
MTESMTVDIDELELFEYRNTVCAVRTSQTRADQPPWYQGIAYVHNNGRDFNQSNWYTKREDAVRMAEVMVRQAHRWYG